MNSEIGEKYPGGKIRMSWAAKGYPCCPTCRFQMGPPEDFDSTVYYCYECDDWTNAEDIRKLQLHLADAPRKSMPKSKKSRARLGSGFLSALLDTWARGIRGMFAN